MAMNKNPVIILGITMKYILKNNQCNKTKVSLICIFSFFMSTNYTLAATIDGYQGQGFVPAGQFSGSVTIPASLSLSAEGARYAGFAIAPTSIGESNICNSFTANWKTIDGYYGYQVSPGVLMVIYDTKITGDVVSSTGGAGNVNGTYGSNGVLSGTIPPKTNAVNCYSYLTGSRTTTISTKKVFSGKHGYYISANATLTSASGISATSIAFRRSGGVGTSFGNYATINQSDKIIVLAPPVTCTVSTPSLINFGEISQPQVTDGKGVTAESALNVNCTKSGGNVGTSFPITYSIKPITQAGGSTTIPLISAGDNTVGDVRGFLGATASSDAGCVNSSSSVLMNGTLAPLRTITSSESWSDPLIWVLCPRKYANPGPAAATVILEVNC